MAEKAQATKWAHEPFPKRSSEALGLNIGESV